MPTVNDILTNFNSGNYQGRLHALTPEDCPFYTLLTGFAQLGRGGGQVAAARTFEWQTYDLRAASATNQVEDSADAPSAANRRRDNVFNVIETHTEAVGVGFERMAQHQQFNVPGDSTLDGENIGQGGNPIMAELPWQVTQSWKQIKRDLEVSLVSGTFNMPADNLSAARTRGILEAITSNIVDADPTDADPQELDFLFVEEAMQLAWDNGGLQEGDTRVLMVPSVHKRQLSWDFHQKGLAPRSRTVFGVNVTQVDTSFGVLNVVLNRHIPDGTAGVFSFEQMQPWYRVVPAHEDVPGGVSFQYRKARDGNRTEIVQYTSIGLEYGNEAAHAKITGLSTVNPATS